MKSQKVCHCYWMGISVVFALSLITSCSSESIYAAENTVVGRVDSQDAHEKSDGYLPDGSKQISLARPKTRAESIHALASHLGLSKGSVVADIGAGNGKDTWVFAEIVGKNGTVYAEEIEEDMVKTLGRQADDKALRQVRPILGCSDDPCLPPNSVDRVYMNRVYHHFDQPRAMLRGFWRSLRPGGYLVVVDQRRGTLRDWVPRSLRATEHFWIAETTVVREAREEGFLFACCAEQLWHDQKGFVLVFQRPKALKSLGHDPDPFLSIPVNRCSRLFLPVTGPYQQPVFIALGQARQLMAPILEHSSGKGLEIVLEEWATQKEERPPLAPGVFLPAVLTDNGTPNLGPEPIDVVFFLDSYHLLFHGKAMLSHLHAKLSPTGCIYIMDRAAEKPLLRREASHRRKIHPETVEQEMTEAGFFLRFRGSQPAHDRFLLVFGKS